MKTIFTSLLITGVIGGNPFQSSLGALGGGAPLSHTHNYATPLSAPNYGGYNGYDGGLILGPNTSNAFQDRAMYSGVGLGAGYNGFGLGNRPLYAPSLYDGPLGYGASFGGGYGAPFRGGNGPLGTPFGHQPALGGGYGFGLGLGGDGLNAPILNNLTNYGKYTSSWPQPSWNDGLASQMAMGGRSGQGLRRARARALRRHLRQNSRIDVNTLNDRNLLAHD